MTPENDSPLRMTASDAASIAESQAKIVDNADGVEPAGWFVILSTAGDRVQIHTIPCWNEDNLAQLVGQLKVPGVEE